MPQPLNPLADYLDPASGRTIHMRSQLKERDLRTCVRCRLRPPTEFDPAARRSDGRQPSKRKVYCRECFAHLRPPCNGPCNFAPQPGDAS